MSVTALVAAALASPLALGGVYLLALALGIALFAGAAVTLALRLRRARLGGRSSRALPEGALLNPTCPTCLRRFPAGTRYCPVDAQRLVAAGSEGAPEVRCPRCLRAFEAGTRFCPFDAEELSPVGNPPWRTPSADAEHHRHGGRGEDADGKICPTCAARYGIDASYCGRDGSELSTIN